MGSTPGRPIEARRATRPAARRRLDETRRTLTQSVVQRLQQRILSGAHPPGTPLPPERDLAARLGVNRNVVREALRQLELLGLVATRWGRGSVVLDVAEAGGIATLEGLLSASSGGAQSRVLRDALDFRVSYAAGILELAAARATARTLIPVRRALLDMQATDDEQTWLECEASFIREVVRLTDNQVFVLLQNTFAAVFKRNEIVRRTWWRHRSQIERAYEHLVSRVTARDVPRATAEVRKLMRTEAAWIRRDERGGG